MSSIKVSVKKARSSADGPIIARFPGGVPPFNDTNLEFLANSKGGPRDRDNRRLVATVTDQCKYVGENFGTQASSFDPCSYAVGVFDPKKKTLTVHPVRATYTMNLDVETESDVADDSLSGLSNKSRRQLLINAFGSRKRRRDQKAQEASQITSSNIAGGQVVRELLKQTASNLGAAAKNGTSQERAIADNRKAFLPPFDAEATEKENVYKFKDVVFNKGALERRSRKFLKLLKDSAAFTEASQAPRKNDLNKFLIKVLKDYHISGGVTPAVQKTIAQTMAMVSYLAKFHRLPHRMKGETMAEIAEKFFIPEPLFKKFCKLFAEVDDSAVKLGGEGSVITISKTDRLKDKLIVWLFAVCLHLGNDFTCTTKELAADLELPAAKVTQYFRLLGCTTKSNQAKLTAPPKFPRRSRGKKK